MIKFLRSALSLQNPFMDLEKFKEWFLDRRSRITHKIEEIALKDLKNWGFDKMSGNLQHDSGKFFSIEGISVETNYGIRKHWSQPIINQPEIGLLGIITKEINGILYFLMLGVYGNQSLEMFLFYRYTQLVALQILNTVDYLKR